MKEVADFTTQVRRACERNHADYVLVDTSRPLEVVLSEYLLNRSRLAGAAARQER